MLPLRAHCGASPCIGELPFICGASPCIGGTSLMVCVPHGAGGRWDHGPARQRQREYHLEQLRGHGKRSSQIRKRIRFFSSLHANNTCAGRIMPFSACNAKISVVAGISWRHGMAPAHIPVFLSQNPSSKNGINRPASLFLAWIRIVKIRLILGVLGLGFLI